MYNPNYEFFAPQGWVCPKCGRVYSPTTSMCGYCGGTNRPPTITTTSTGDYIPDMVKTISHIGGSDYWDEKLKEWKNTIETQTNNLSFLDWYIKRDNKGE